MGMRVSFSDLLKRPVQTLGGVPIGMVVDVECDAENGRLLSISVKRGRLSRTTSVIAWEQIVEIRPEAVIVKDTWVTAVNSVMAPIPA